MSDEYDLQRFVRAQDPVYGDAIAILRRGMICTHYMEFVFPRLASWRPVAVPEPFDITSLDEASAYVSSPILGGRYRECIGTLQRLFEVSPRSVFGEAVARKLYAIADTVFRGKQ